jgi:hypothetical protein
VTRNPADPTRRTGKGHIGWVRMYERLLRFIEENGRFPNSTFPTLEEQRLRSWIHTQRNAHAGIGTAVISRERAQLLEAINGWEW